MGEGEACVAVLNDGDMASDALRTESKRHHEFLVDSTETDSEPCAKKQAKEASTDMILEPSSKAKEASYDDICSEVSNPKLSPKDNNLSFQTVSSQLVGRVSNDYHGACGEITSCCSGNSSMEESSSDEEHEHDTSDSLDPVPTSQFVIEIPKHVSTTGVRKITFKFSKRKEDYDNQLSDSASGYANNGFHDGFDNVTNLAPWLVDHRNAEMKFDTYGKRFEETSHPLLGPPYMDTSMCEKVFPEGFSINVKKLLSTGILEGARVKYVPTSGIRALPGIIKDWGYLCSCSICNFSKILSAHEFEMHAGGKSRHPNNHIYLENGNPIYSIIHKLKTAPLSQVDEVIKDLAGSSVNEELLQVWKANLQRNNEFARADKSHQMRFQSVCRYTASCPNQVMEDYNSPTSSSYFQSFPVQHQIYMKEIPEEHKRLIKKPRSYFSSPVMEHKRTAEGGTKKRDNDLHRSLFMPNGLPDGTNLAYYSKGQKILEGYKQGNGIVCSHCHTEISPSQFEAHAGWAAKRQPYRHIYTSSGMTLHDIALLLTNGQKLVTTNSDDMCAVCGDGGELIICDRCPHAFHAGCLEIDFVPTGDWHCPYCRDKLGPGRKATGGSRPILLRLTRVVKAPESETGGCVVCRANDFSVDTFDERTVMLCDQCEKEYHVGCLRDSGLCDLKELPKEKWFCCNSCIKIHVVMRDLVLNGAEVIPDVVLSTVNKKHVDRGLKDGATDDIQWRILSGKSRDPEHLPLLSRAAAIFRECFDPIVAKSGRDLIPVMVYGRNISGQEFGGMHCVVLIVKSVVVCAGLLRIFGQEVAELPLVATNKENQGKGYFQALFSCIERLLLSLSVGNLVLPAAEEAESIWTKKLGFRKMSDERLSKYTRDDQLTRFKGTSMLEKELKHISD